MRKSTFLAVAIAATMSTTAFAQPPVANDRATVGETYINIFGGNTFYDSNAGLGIRSQNNAGVGGFRVGTRMAPHIGAELDFDYARAPMQNSFNDMTNQYTGALVGVFYAFDKDSTPFMTIGVGASNNRYTAAADRNTALMGVWGLGYKQRLGRSLDLRFDAQNQILFNPQPARGSQLSNLRLTAGVGFAWGGSKPMMQAAAAPAPAPQPAPQENVPPPVPPVAAEPMPAPAPMPAPQTEVERTLLAHKPVVIEAAQFGFDSSKIKPHARTTLEEVVDFAKKYPDARLNIGGHTDNIGSYGYNMRLSLRRAKAVESYLVKHGVPKDRITVRGYSYSKPIASNKTAAGRAKNRRAEIRSTITVEQTTHETR